jgi:hypothetical protein
MKRVVAAAVLVAAASGCASSPEARRAEEAQRIRCASIEIFPSGISPGRPYRVLGPISVDASTRAGDQGLRDRACGLGADAVVDYRREVPSITAAAPGSTYGDPAGDRVVLSGTAIAFTDGTAATTTAVAPPPAAEATAIGTPPPAAPAAPAAQ